MDDVRGPGREMTATAAGIAAAVAVSVASSGVSLWEAAADDRSVLNSALSVSVVIAFSVVGAVIAAARPGNRVGWLMLAGGVAWSVGDAAVSVAYHGIVAAPGSVAAPAAYAVPGQMLRSLGWYCLTLALPIYFPDGRLAGPRWRWLSRSLVVVVIGTLIDPLSDPAADLTDFGEWQNPLSTFPGAPVVSAVAFFAHIPLSVAVTVGAIAQLASRWRHGDLYRRQQLGLYAAAAGLTIVAVPLAFASGAGGWAFSVAALPLPFVIGFAVLAHGLYDLRTAANRTLVWLTLSAVVVGVYALVIAGVGAVLHIDQGTPWLPWVAAAVVALSFAPLRDGLQRGVNRLTFGRWDEPYDVLASLGQRLELTADAERLLDDVVTELTGLGLRDVAVRDEDGRLVAGGSDAGQPFEVALSAYGRKVGSLRYRPPETPLRDRDRRLLDDIAGHLGGVLHAHRLTADLQRARERLVLAREEERRRLRRDLHDGLGPALAGHVLRLDVLAGKLGPASAVTADVESLREDLRSTVLEVRRVVEGLRPPALDELGLTAALERVTSRLAAGTPTSVTLEVGELPPLSAAVEVAAFRIVTEAVTNVVTHAEASCCRIELTAAAGLLRIVVADDGRGLGAAASGTAGSGAAGHGLQTMRERAEELRGRLEVSSSRGSEVRGTDVVAELPLPLTAGPRLPSLPVPSP
jgi:signal transduction histidine kinase